MSKSIVVKLTLFVGVLVGLNTALLIGAAYWTTGAILGEQVRDRLTSVADDRQEILLHEMKRLQARAVAFGGRPRMRSMFAGYASGSMPAERFVEQAGYVLTMIQSHSSDLLAMWVEDESGKVLASSGPPGVIAELKANGRGAPDAEAEGWMAVPPERVNDTYAAVFCGAVRDNIGRRLGRGLPGPGPRRRDGVRR